MCLSLTGALALEFIVKREDGFLRAIVDVAGAAPTAAKLGL